MAIHRYTGTRPNQALEYHTNWLTCFLRDGKFHGACGPERLEDMLEIFLDWAEDS